MLVRTSKNGAVLKGIPDARGHEKAHFRLTDFDIDGHALKFEHVKWLHGQVVNVIQHQPKHSWRITLTGGTSRTGSQSHNLQLSRQRASDVQTLLHTLLGHGSHVTFVSKGVGPQNAHGRLMEDAGDRAVEVVLQDVTPPDPPKPPPPPPGNKGIITNRPVPPKGHTPGVEYIPLITDDQQRTPHPVPAPPPPPPPPINPPHQLPVRLRKKTFIIRQAGAANVSAPSPIPLSFTTDLMAFVIVDVEKPNDTAYYGYFGAGGGVSIPLVDWLSKAKKMKAAFEASKKLWYAKTFVKYGAVTITGPANYFSLVVPETTNAYDFSGYAWFGSLSKSMGSSVSSNHFSFGSALIFDDRYSAVSIPGFSTDRTFGLPSGTATAGYMQCVNPH